MKIENVMVSVVCLTYNHEKYIRKALEGFVSQKTNFDFEVIVHDDASTDHTRMIIEEYVSKYPHIIKPIYQTENQWSKKVKITPTFICPIARGKYIAYCEGDDFWTDCHKLQKQYDAMEEHPECSICTHTVQRVFEDGSLSNGFHPQKKMSEGKLSAQDFLNMRSQYPFQTSSFFVRHSLWYDLMMNPPEFRKVSDVGDEPTLLYMVAHGDIYYISENMSSYRTMSVGSWSSRQQKNPQKRLDHVRRMYQMICLYDEYTKHQYDCHLLKAKCTLLRFEGKFKEILKKCY